MPGNVKSLHDNSPMSSFRLSSAGCMPRQLNRACHDTSPLITQSYFKNNKERDLFISADFCAGSNLPLTGPSSQCPSSRPVDYINTCLLCRVSDSLLNASWQDFGSDWNSVGVVFCTLLTALLCICLSQSSWCPGGSCFSLWKQDVLALSNAILLCPAHTVYILMFWQYSMNRNILILF